jgi:peptidoglycan/LPS O-acetylase OafA/YrhL
MKARYEVLDGLRGTAALSVVALHLCQVFRPTAAGNPMHHAYLAVDFFYMLSGFVMGHAYDDRWGRMGLRDFFGQRLRRLHPLVVLGVLLGLHGYLVERLWLGGGGAPLLPVLANLGLALLLLPAPSLPGHAGQTYSLDGPSWSLGQEYLANVAYALFARRLSRAVLAAVVVGSGAALVAIGATYGTLDVGWSWSSLWLAPARTAFPFFAGLLLHRLGARLRIGAGFAGLSLALLAIFLAPTLSGAANGLFEAAIVIGVFPLVIAAGAAARAPARTKRLCAFAGELSYPLYIVHYPLVRCYGAWVWAGHASHAVQLAAGVGLALMLPLAAWAALKLYDQPLRARLSAGRAGRKTAQPVGRTRPASTA